MTSNSEPAQGQCAHGKSPDLCVQCEKELIAQLRLELPEFIRAAFDGDIDAVRSMIANGHDINETDENNWSALHAAIRSNNVRLVELLVESGADVNVGIKSGWSPICQAARSNAWIVNYLIEHGASVSVSGELSTEVALDAACINDQPAAVRFLVAAGAQLQNVHLFYAAQAGALDAVKVLIALGLDGSATWPEDGSAVAGRTAAEFSRMVGTHWVADWLEGQNDK